MTWEIILESVDQKRHAIGKVKTLDDAQTLMNDLETQYEEWCLEIAEGDDSMLAPDECFYYSADILPMKEYPMIEIRTWENGKIYLMRNCGSIF